jgi:hypothetical protein
VTDIEQRLSRELRGIAEGARPDSLRPLRVPPPRRRFRTVRWLAPVTAAAAVAGLVVGVTVAGHSAGQPGRHQPVSQHPSRMPKYYVTVEDQRNTSGAVVPRTENYVIRAVVRASATGVPISSVPLISGSLRRSLIPQPPPIIGATNDRAFLIILSKGMEILHIASDGHVLGLTRLPKKIFDLGGGFEEVGEDVLSPNGTEVVVPIDPRSCALRNSCARGIGVYSVTTGVITKWIAPTSHRGVDIPVNWPGFGHEVLVSNDVSGYRLLNVAGPGGGLLADSRPVRTPKFPHGWVTNGFLLLPGDKSLLTAASRFPSKTATSRVLETSASTGRVRRVLHVFSVPNPSGGVPFCFAESLGPSGVHALMWCANRFGRLDGSHFTPLPGQSSGKSSLLSGSAAW